MKESTFFQRNKEILLGVVMIALAAFYLVSSLYIRMRSNVSVNARMIPQILGCIVLLLGVFQVRAGMKYLAAVRERDAAEGKTAVGVSKAEKRDAVPVIHTFIIILAYAVLFEPLGFVISSILCMFLQMWVLSPKSAFRPAKFFAISVVVALAVHVIFKMGLELSLPGGVLEGFGF